MDRTEIDRTDKDSTDKDSTERKHSNRGAYGMNYAAGAVIVALALSGCSPTRVVATAVGAAGSAATSAVSTVGGAVVSTASTVASGAAGVAGVVSASPGAAAGGAGVAGAAGGAGIAPEVIPVAASAAAAQSAGDNSDLNNDAVGSQISQKIIAGVLFCANIEKIEYRIDCFADQLDQAAQDVPDDADLGQARSILSDAAAQMAGVAQNRASRGLRPVTLSSASPTGARSNRAIQAVETDELPAAFAEADLILEEAQTLLLRASETSLRRKLAYVDIAEAVGSSKVLLRSA